MVPLVYLLFNKQILGDGKRRAQQKVRAFREERRRVKRRRRRFSTSRCSGMWRLVRCEYEALRRGATLVSTWLLWVLPVDIPRTTA